jgi:hypothetical protein
MAEFPFDESNGGLQASFLIRREGFGRGFGVEVEEDNGMVLWQVEVDDPGAP